MDHIKKTVGAPHEMQINVGVGEGKNLSLGALTAFQMLAAPLDRPQRGDREGRASAAPRPGRHSPAQHRHTMDLSDLERKKSPAKSV